MGRLSTLQQLVNTSDRFRACELKRGEQMPPSLTIGCERPILRSSLLDSIERESTIKQEEARSYQPLLLTRGPSSGYTAIRRV